MFRAKFLAEKHQERILEAVRYPKESKVKIKRRNAVLELTIDIPLENRNEQIKFYTEPSTFRNFTGRYTLDSSSNRLKLQ